MRETKWSMDDLMQIVRIEEGVVEIRNWVRAHEAPRQPDALAILDNFEKCFRAADFGENDDDRNACRQYLAGLRKVLEGTSPVQTNEPEATEWVSNAGPVEIQSTDEDFDWGGHCGCDSCKCADNED